MVKYRNCVVLCCASRINLLIDQVPLSIQIVFGDLLTDGHLSFAALIDLSLVGLARVLEVPAALGLDLPD